MKRTTVLTEQVRLVSLRAIDTLQDAAESTPESAEQAEYMALGVVFLVGYCTYLEGLEAPSEISIRDIIDAGLEKLGIDNG